MFIRFKEKSREREGECEVGRDKDMGKAGNAPSGGCIIKGGNLKAPRVVLQGNVS